MSNYAITEKSIVINIIVWNGLDKLDLPSSIELVKIEDGVIAAIGFPLGNSSENRVGAIS